MPVSFKFDPEKATAMVSWLASKGLSELTKGKLCKLVFLADRLHLVRYGRPITGDWFAAVSHGPIPSRILDMLNAIERERPADVWTENLARHVRLDRNYDQPRISVDGPIAMDTLSQSDIRAMEETAEKYGQLSFAQLRDLTHGCEAYSSAWAKREEGSSAHRMDFEEFFDDEPEAIAGVKEDVMENAAIAEAFSCQR